MSGNALVEEQRQYGEYSKAFKAKALATLTLNDYNQKKTAEQLDVPRSTVRNWHDKMEDGWLSEDAELQELYQSEINGAEPILRQLWVRAAMELLQGKRLQEASTGEVNALFGTAFDKWRLASGQSTENIEKKVRVVNIEGQEL